MSRGVGEAVESPSRLLPAVSRGVGRQLRGAAASRRARMGPPWPNYAPEGQRTELALARGARSCLFASGAPLSDVRSATMRDPQAVPEPRPLTAAGGAPGGRGCWREEAQKPCGAPPARGDRCRCRRTKRRPRRRTRQRHPCTGRSCRRGSETRRGCSADARRGTRVWQQGRPRRVLRQDERRLRSPQWRPSPGHARSRRPPRGNGRGWR